MSRMRLAGVGILGILLVGVVLTIGWIRGGDRTPKPNSGLNTRHAATVGEPNADFLEGLRQGAVGSLTIVADRLKPADAVEGARAAIALAPSPEEADELLVWLDAIRIGFNKFGGASKVVALEAAKQILDRFAAEGTPAGWSRVLPLAFDTIAGGLSDRDPAVRIAAADLVGELWNWSPGCTMGPGEEADLASWKEGFYPLILQRLTDPEGPSRAAAVRSLGHLPIDDRAAPAIAGIRDGDFSVRYQTVVSFANRPGVLATDDLLPLLHDPVPDLSSLAERILKARGLNQEQVGLSKLVSHNRADIRASAIPLLLKRDDIDPVVWLLRLTEDTDASVRLDAVHALEGYKTAEVQRRLFEMATADDSEDVRAAAAKLAPASSDQRVSLPPLPGAPSLNLRAN